MTARDNGHALGRAAPLADELAAFDALPRAVRDLVNDAPIKLSAPAIGEMVALHGEAAARRCIPMICRALSGAAVVAVQPIENCQVAGHY